MLSVMRHLNSLNYFVSLGIESLFMFGWDFIDDSDNFEGQRPNVLKY